MKKSLGKPRIDSNYLRGHPPGPHGDRLFSGNIGGGKSAGIIGNGSASFGITG